MRAIKEKGLQGEERILACTTRPTFYTRITGHSTCTSVRSVRTGWCVRVRSVVINHHDVANCLGIE
jgi:hypothetical protein